MAEEQIQRARQLIAELATVLRDVPDIEVPRVLTGDKIDELLCSIFDPRAVGQSKSVADFFLENKFRGAMIAALRNGITRAGSIAVDHGGVRGYVSPAEPQWFDDSVLLLEGNQPFQGMISKYKPGEQPSYAMSLRDAKSGDQLTQADFEFIPLDETRRRLAALKPPASDTDLDAPICQLRALLDANCSDESQFQELLARYPWAFGMQYRDVLRHEPLDDENVPDFTGVRVTDDCRDIIELKPVSMRLFRADGAFSADFNIALSQVKRYLLFAREQSSYLLSKGRRFENPRCYLVCGRGLTPQQRAAITAEEKLNPAIHIMTYDDLLALMEHTVTMIKKLRDGGGPAAQPSSDSSASAG